jgi:hypothetical protein
MTIKQINQIIMKLHKKISLLFVASLLLVSCEKTDQFSTNSTPLVAYVDLTPTTTADAVIATATPATVQYAADDIIEAYVTSSDEGGTFYNSVSFQTKGTATASPVGFSIGISQKTFPYGLTPGRKVYIKLKDLYYSVYNGSVVFGALYNGYVGRLSASEWQKYIFLSKTVEPEDSLARNMTLAQATAFSTANYDPNVNTLINLINVRFSDTSLNRTFYDVDSGGGATNHNLVDVTNPNFTEFFRVSSYALFAYKNIPSGVGSIRAVLTKYGTDYQFIPRFETDVRLTTDRNFTYAATLNETFESYRVEVSSTRRLTNQQYDFPNYLNILGKGSKYWMISASTSTPTLNPTSKWLEMSAYRTDGTGEYNKSYFMVPVDFGAANSVSFQSRTQYYDNKVLKVFMTNDYIVGSDISKATLFDITDNFAISTASGTGAQFLNSGVYNFPTAFNKKGFLVFEYSGNSFMSGPAVTSTMQLDNIIIQ